MSKKILLMTSDELVGADILFLLEDLKLNFNIHLCQTVAQLANILLEERIELIVMDTYLPAVHDLSSIGKPEVNTLDGMWAGFAILEYFLREENSPYRDIPVLLLTAKRLSKKEKELKEKLKVEYYIELYGPNWKQEFEEVITQVKGGTVLCQLGTTG